MDGFSLVDIYSTKGIEYLVAVVFFFGFLGLQYYLLRPERRRANAPAPNLGGMGRFRVPDGYSFHQGHTWMKMEPSVADRLGLARVGLDDFAQKLVGKVDSVELPPVGSRLAQGDKGWRLVVGSVPITMLSPVDGEVVEVNPEVLRSPGILNRDPYGEGWLLKVKSDRVSADIRNLLSGKVARGWMENALENLYPAREEGLGPVMQDGGVPVEGIAKALAGDHWEHLARTHLLTEEA
jgi:glycine cleavage system H lipoate-binding protein